MQIIPLNTSSTQQLPKMALTIGNFDGVHKGHQEIIKRLQKTGQQEDLKTAVMFFEPQPKEFFAKTANDAPPRITSKDEKIALLTALNVDYAIVAEFNEQFRQQSAQDFAERLQDLNVTHIMVGDDFKFGFDRIGNSQYLADFGFSLDTLDTYILDEERVSSSRIRDALASGDFQTATALLGRPYTITGVVEKGDQIGRTINFPTANIALNRMCPCLHGIYGVEVVEISDNNACILDSASNNTQGVNGLQTNSLFGAAHVGTRPAIKDKTPEWRCEVNFPEFSGDLYGKILQVTFLYFLHGEQDYPNLAALQTGIANDVKQLLAWQEKQRVIL